MTAERRIALLFTASIVAALALTVVYVEGGQPQLEGALLAVALGGMGAGIVLWAKRLFPDEEITDERPSLLSTAEAREDVVERLEQGEEAFARRAFLTRLLAGAAGALGLAALFPLRSLGPSPGRALFRTAWRSGARLVTESGSPVHVADLPIGSILTVFPEGHVGRDDSATLLIRVEAARLDLEPGRAGWAPEGNVAYSKLCTHVGCPVGLYREATHELICPCHQSTFDVLAGAKPTFGPATRSLPQLPLDVDRDGYLVARSDYTEPVGPAFWNRGRH